MAGAESPPGLGLYLHKADDTFVPISHKNGGQFSGYEVSVASQDYTHIFFLAGVPQVDGYLLTGGGNVNELHNGVIKLVGILPGGEVAPGGATIPPTRVGAEQDDHVRRQQGAVHRQRHRAP